MSDVHLDTAERLIEEGRAPSERISAYALISIAESLQLITKALDIPAIHDGALEEAAQECDRFLEKLNRQTSERNDGAFVAITRLAKNIRSFKKAQVRPYYHGAKPTQVLVDDIPPSLGPDTVIARLHEVSEMGSNRFLGICARAGINTLGDLAALTEKEFWLNKHCGYRTLNEARMILGDAGLAFQPGERIP